jgi:hypothetical protein
MLDFIYHSNDIVNTSKLVCALYVLGHGSARHVSTPLVRDIVACLIADNIVSSRISLLP